MGLGTWLRRVFSRGESRPTVEEAAVAPAATDRSPGPAEDPAGSEEASPPQPSEGVSTTASRPGAEGATPAPSAAVVPPTEATEDARWFSEGQIRFFSDAEDEAELSRRIAKMDPGASREEVLFRYRLSRAVYFSEFQLPILPSTATEVMRLGREARADVHDYVQVIQGDPSLVSATLQVSNSIFFSALEECRSLERAIVRIGIAEVERIALVHTFRSRLFRVPGHEALVRQIVDHGVATSYAALAVARDLRLSGAEAFLAGLLHDVGKLVLLQIVGEVQRKLDWRAPRELIESAFHAFHTQVGELLCESWHLPSEISEAVGAHHDAEASAETPLRQSVYLGNRIAHELDVVSVDGDSPVESLDALREDPVVVAAGLTPERLTALGVRLAEDLASLGVSGSAAA